MAGNVVSNVKKYYGGQVPVPSQGDSDGKVKVLVEKTATIEIGGVQTEVELLYDADDLTTPVTPQQLGQWTDENYLIAFKKREDDGRVRGFILYALETDSTSADTLVNRAEFIAFKEDMTGDPGASAYEFTMVEDSSTLARYLRDENGELIVKFDKASVEDGAQSDTLDNLIGSDSEYMRFEVVREGDNAYLNLNTESLDEKIEYIQEDINYLVGAIDELPSDEHGYFNSSIYMTPGDGTTTNLVMDDFRIAEGRDVSGENIEFVPTRQEGGVDFGNVYLEPGTYILAIQYTLQWVGNPRGTFLPKVCSVADQPFDFSYEHEDVIRVTRIVTRTTRGKLVTNIPIDADTPKMGIWVKNLEIAQIASYNHTAVAHDTTLTGTGKLDSPLGVTPAAFGKIKDIPTSISQFRTGDVIPVDGPNGPAQIGADTIFDNFAGKFEPNKVGGYKKYDFVIHQGGMYRFTADHSGAWTGSDVTAVKVEELINQLNTQAGDLVKEFFEEAPNIFAGINSSLSGYYKSNGIFQQNDDYRVTNPVLLAPNTEYKVTHNPEIGSNYFVFLCDKDGNIERPVEAVLSDGLLVFTHDRAQYGYALFNYGYPSSTDFMVGRSSTFPAEYIEPEGWMLNIMHFAEKLIGVVPMDNLPSVISNNGVVIKHSPNLYDKSDLSGCISDYYIGSYRYVSASGYQITQPIYVQGGVTYKATHDSSIGDNFYYAILNDDLSYRSSAYGANDSGDTNYIVFTPEASSYIRLNLGSGTLQNKADSFILSKYDEFPERYIEYGRSIADDVKLGEKQVEEVVAIATSAPNLVGKKISLNGDSICAGAGFHGGYGKIIADMFNMTYENIGVGGGTIQAETYYSGSGDPRHWICRTITNMSADADYIILEGGVNDDVSSSMGSITSGYDDALDDTTFYGAFESMLKQALIRFPGKKIGYIAVHKMDNFDSRNTDPTTSKYLATKLCCEKWGVPFLDLNTTVPPFARFPETGGLYTNLKEVFTRNADGWHPNEQGYKKFYVPKIVAWMNTL